MNEGGLDPERLRRYRDITHDSRAVVDGSMFACVVGQQHDGHDFAWQAVERGATGLLVERRLGADELRTSTERADAIEQIVVGDVRSAMAIAAAVIQGFPASGLTMVGVTGTNGKTTTTHLLASLLGLLGRPTEQIGTLSNARTTPEAPDLQRQLRRFVDAGSEAVVMEVSSHALVFNRVDAVTFDLAVFTNLGHDHLDLHGSLDDYFAAKASLFEPSHSKSGLVNADDPWGRRLLGEATIPMHEYSLAQLESVEIGIAHSSFVWRGHRVEVPFGGQFNVVNALAALEAAYILGFDVAEIARHMSETSTVPGRFEPVTSASDPFAVIVDYAHTPEGIASLCATGRSLVQNGKIILVFGCGGDRDREKRPLMGAAAAQGADVVILTSDNPRTEDPLRIIDDVRSGIPATVEPLVEPDRKLAIEWAVRLAEPGDVVFIAGKGHETTQTIGTTSVAFSDQQVARAALESAA